MIKVKWNEKAPAETIGSHLNSGAAFDGQLHVEGNIRIDGVFKGSIRCDGLLVVGREGTVEGPVTCRDLHLEGRLTGTVQSGGLVKLTAGCFMEGDIIAAQLEVQQGALFSGRSAAPAEQKGRHLSEPDTDPGE